MKNLVIELRKIPSLIDSYQVWFHDELLCTIWTGLSVSETCISTDSLGKIKEGILEGYSAEPIGPYTSLTVTIAKIFTLYCEKFKLKKPTAKVTFEYKEKEYHFYA